MAHRRCAQIAAALFFLVTLITAIATGLPAQPAPPDLSQVRVVSVAPFIDEVGMHEDLTRWAATRLAALLSSRGVHVVPATQVELALQETGLRPADLFSLAATETLAHRLQADAVITGRLVDAESEGGGMSGPMERGSAKSTVTFALRLMVVATRRVSYTRVTGYAMERILGFVRAADQALEGYASSWPMVRP